MKEDHQQRALSPWCMDGRSVRRRFPEREGAEMTNGPVIEIRLSEALRTP